MKLPRRKFLSAAAAMLPFSYYPGLALGSDVTQPKRLLTLFLKGAWDSHLATDPIYGSRLSTSNFASEYSSYGYESVSGKSNLLIGAGLFPMRAALASVPTAFVNGIYMEVSAHEIAFNYMLSSKLSLSRSREYPALAAILGSKSTAYPPHLVLGSGIPLAETRTNAPPLHSSSLEQIAKLLSGPGQSVGSNYKSTTVPRAHKLLSDLDTAALNHLNNKQRSGLVAWQASASRLEELYGRKLGPSLELSDSVKTRYSVGNNWEIEGQIAGAFLALSSGLTPYITVVPSANFDTHSSHFALHKPLLERTARTIQVLIDDLRNTADPSQPSKKLIETTTILITSEFVRTPKLNGANGTDHWQSASAILMGAGVKDNVQIGSTDATGAALGWSSGPVARTADTALAPEHLGSALANYLGFSDVGSDLSSSPLSAVIGA